MNVMQTSNPVAGDVIRLHNGTPVVVLYLTAANQYGVANPVCAWVTEWQGQRRLALRECYRNASGLWAPTKSGIDPPLHVAGRVLNTALSLLASVPA